MAPGTVTLYPLLKICGSLINWLIVAAGFEVVDEEDEDASGRVVRPPCRRQDDPFRRRRRWRDEHVADPAAVAERERDDLLLDVVLVHLEVFAGQIRHEIPGRVARDDVGRHEVDLHREGRSLRRGGRLLCSGA